MFESEPEPELQQPHDVPAARQGAGRHQLDQRHGLHARQPGRLRRVARSAAAPAGTGTASCPISRRPRTRSAAPTRRTASAARCGVCDHPVRWELAEHLDRRGGRGRPAAQQRFQQRRAGRRRAFPEHDEPRRGAGAPRPPISVRRSSRANLTIATEALATKVLFEGGRAVGVAYRQRGVPKEARARGEIVVCGGVYGSPQLLQLSGRRAGRPAAAARHPGGARHAAVSATELQDHFYVRLAFRCTQPITLNDVGNSSCGGAPRRASSTSCSTPGRWPATASAPAASRAATRASTGPTSSSISAPGAFRTATNAACCRIPFPGFSVSAVHLRPDARGTVRIKSPDPPAPPSIRFNFLKTQYDLDALTRRHAPGAQDHRAAGDRAASRRAKSCPAPQVQTDAEFEAAIRANGLSNLHPVGTCRMGPDEAAVLRPAPPGQRRRASARRRRLGHARGAGRQHQRADDHDRRKGRRT